ncbi:MAG: helix-turn-helix domain-containing protein [Nitrospinae bacterium]|nr:helix-turn-helix domain-containing protein [Nitrospinota bacterium]
MAANDLLTMKQVCELVGLSHTTIHRLRNENDFPSPIKLGQAAVRFRRDEVEAWLANRPRVDERRHKAAASGA